MMSTNNPIRDPKVIPQQGNVEMSRDLVWLQIQDRVNVATDV